MPQPCRDFWAHRSTYHIDPHPQFSPKDTWVVYTATPEGRPTVALCPLDQQAITEFDTETRFHLHAFQGKPQRD
jgi:Tol biopolymer transport system component